MQTATKLKGARVDLFSAGDFAEWPGRENIEFRDPGRGIYKWLVIEGARLLGAVMYGDTADGAWFFSQIKDGTDITPLRHADLWPGVSGGDPSGPSGGRCSIVA